MTLSGYTLRRFQWLALAGPGSRCIQQALCPEGKVLRTLVSQAGFLEEASSAFGSSAAHTAPTRGVLQASPHPAARGRHGGAGVGVSLEGSKRSWLGKLRLKTRGQNQAREAALAAGLKGGTGWSIGDGSAWECATGRVLPPSTGMRGLLRGCSPASGAESGYIGEMETRTRGV